MFSPLVIFPRLISLAKKPLIRFLISAAKACIYSYLYTNIVPSSPKWVAEVCQLMRMGKWIAFQHDAFESFQNIWIPCIVLIDTYESRALT